MQLSSSMPGMKNCVMTQKISFAFHLPFLFQVIVEGFRNFAAATDLADEEIDEQSRMGQEFYGVYFFSQWPARVWDENCGFATSKEIYKLATMHALQECEYVTVRSSLKLCSFLAPDATVPPKMRKLIMIF